jgi:NAD(P)H-flavin reductase
MQNVAETADFPQPMTPELYRVERVRRETADTYTLDLSPTAGPSMSFAPGQFNMLYAFGKGEVPISISGDPASTEPLIHTVRAVGAVTREIAALKAGAVLGVRGPFGSNWPVHDARGSDVVIVAGGIGLAPLRPALYSILAHRRQYGSVSLLYGTRTPKDLLYEKELHVWRGRFDLNVEVTVDHAAGEFFEHVGVVTRLIPRTDFDPEETFAFVCGPEIMMRFTVRDLIDRGVPAERIFLSVELNMQCAIGLCGHCQLGPTFVCKDGPVFRYSFIEPFLKIREI